MDKPHQRCPLAGIAIDISMKLADFMLNAGLGEHCGTQVADNCLYWRSKYANRCAMLLRPGG
jgi:hypothetical protein